MRLHCCAWLTPHASTKLACLARTHMSRGTYAMPPDPCLNLLLPHARTHMHRRTLLQRTP